MRCDNFSILLADDDVDDYKLFKDALDELIMPVSLKTMTDGIKFMSFLTSNSANLPNVLFLDLNMPLKSGYECLSEIKENEKLQQLPVIIYSTSANPEVMDLLYEKGALYYIRKPAEFSKLKSVIKKAISLIKQNKLTHTSKEHFVLQP